MVIINREVYSRTERTSDRWETPPYFFKLLDDKYHFTLDPCASDENHLCDKYYTIKEDGLKQDWNGERIFVNPPYSNIKEWVKKCWDEATNDVNTLVALLIPARTDTHYFHEYCMNAYKIYFCKGRINFLLDGKKPKNGSTFPSIVVIFKDHLNYEGGPKMRTLIHKGVKKNV